MTSSQPGATSPTTATRRRAPRLLGLVATALLLLQTPGFAAPTVGSLVAVGGGSEDPALMREILELAKGKDTRVAVVNTASSEPAKSGPIYLRFFQALGVANVSVVPLVGRDSAYEPAVLEALGQADMIYFTGGNQIRLAQTLADTPAHGALLAAWQRGAVIAGTSAGAMIWGPQYLAAGTSAGALLKRREGGLDMKPGLGLLPDVVVDTHFGREGRLGRLIVAASQLPGLAGIGIDERTAAVISPESVRVMGEGRVTIVDLAHAKLMAQAGPVFSARDIEMHLLSAGDSLRWHRDDSERVPMLPARSRESMPVPSFWLQGAESPPTWGRGVADPTMLFARLPEEILILAGDGAAAVAQHWQTALAASGRTTVRILPASQLPGPALLRYLPMIGGMVLIEDGQGSLARALTGEPGRQLRQFAGRIQMAAAGPAVAIPGETATRLGATNGELMQGQRLVPGLMPTADLWAPGAIDRLVVDALLSGGSLGIGLSAGNGVRLEAGSLKVSGESPVLLLETDKVSVANPAGPSARDLRLHVVAPGEEFAL